MDQEQASLKITEVDSVDHEERINRLVQLMDAMPTSEHIGFAGTGPQLMFEDVKATWIYGAFTSTIITSYVFCMQQLANKIRLFGENVPDHIDTLSLETIANIAADLEIIEVDIQARLIQLNDLSMAYMLTSTVEHRLLLDQHFADATQFSNGHPLLADAEHAMLVAISLLETAG